MNDDTSNKTRGGQRAVSRRVLLAAVAVVMTTETLPHVPEERVATEKRGESESRRPTAAAAAVPQLVVMAVVVAMTPGAMVSAEVGDDKR